MRVNSLMTRGTQVLMRAVLTDIKARRALMGKIAQPGMTVKPTLEYVI
jgi:hypothetical protein